MKKSHFKASLLLLLLGWSPTLFSQVNISTTGAVPSANAVLDLNTGNANNQGLIIPNVTLGSSLSTFNPPIANAATSNDVGRIVYTSVSTNQPVGYYYWNGSSWISVTGSPSWSLTGNSGTNPGTNYSKCNFFGTWLLCAKRFQFSCGYRTCFLSMFRVP